MRDAPARILIADDDEICLKATAEALRHAGYQCDCARDAQEAIAALRGGNPYDLLITDIHMPGNTKLELLHVLARNQPPLPVMLVTGYPTVDTAVEALRLSVVDYLMKPLDFPAVLGRIGQAIDKGRILRSLHQAREETSAWANTIEQLAKACTYAGGAGSSTRLAWPVEQFMEQMMGQMLKLTLGFRTTLDLVSKGQAAQSQQGLDLCSVARCPRRVAYQQALKEVIEVLEKTKTAFKSKDLANLRHRLEDLLEDDR